MNAVFPCRWTIAANVRIRAQSTCPVERTRRPPLRTDVRLRQCHPAPLL